MSRRIRISAFVIAGAALLALGWCSPWHGLIYRGDGTLLDQGEWSFPRYVLRLNKISFSRPGEYVFHLRGLPRERLTLAFRVIKWPDNLSDLSALKSNHPEIDIVITDGQGKDVCRAGGRPRGTNEDGSWVLAQGPDSGEYWHWRCNDVEFRSFEAYSLVIRVSDATLRGDEIIVEPMLTGGGTELP